MASQPKGKVLVATGEGQVPLRLSNVFQQEQVNGVDRLVVGAADGVCELMLKLAAPGGKTFACLYERREAEQDSRTQSGKMSIEQVREIVTEFRELLETDPRHNFTIYNHESETRTVLDEHNFIFVYNKLEGAKGLLATLGFTEGAVELPTPHIHYYPDSGPELEAALLARLTATQGP